MRECEDCGEWQEEISYDAEYDADLCAHCANERDNREQQIEFCRDNEQ